MCLQTAKKYLRSACSLAHEFAENALYYDPSEASNGRVKINHNNGVIRRLESKIHVYAEAARANGVQVIRVR